MNSITSPDPSTKTRPEFDGTELGPRMAKALKKALTALARWETQRIEKRDYGSFLVGSPSGPITNQTARDLFVKIHKDFDGTATKKNYKAIIQAVEDALPAAREGAEVLDERTSPEEQAKRKKEEEEARTARVAERAKEKEEAEAKWAPFWAKKPANAQAMILAELDHDESDSMTDYFSHSTSRRVLIGWRTGKREDFKQLRRAAGQFEHTAHLGLGKDDWSVIAKPDPQEGNNGRGHYSRIPKDERGIPVRFTTEQEARAWVDAQLEDLEEKTYPRVCDWTDYATDYGVNYNMESVEHRENYSMGGGNYLKRGGKNCSGWKVSSYNIPEGGGAPWVGDIEDGIPEATVNNTEAGGGPANGLREGFTVQKSTNKRGEFFLVSNSERIPRDEYLPLRESAKKAGGWQARAWAGKPGGFGFNTEAEAQAWAGGAGVEAGPSQEPERLEALAAKMQPDIDYKRADLTQNPTHRRLRIKEGQRRDADRLEQIQEGLQAVASAMRAGTLPRCLEGLTSRAAVERELQNPALRELVGSAGDMARALIHEEQEKAAKLDELRFAKIPGFFPTPPDVVERAIELADLEPGQTILEPSAGIGSMMEGIPEECQGSVHWVEQNPTLYKITREKDLAPRLSGHCDDFLNTGDLFHGEFDRVVMNPPFERGQAITHTVEAARCLKEGGRLVAVVPPNAFEKIEEAINAQLDGEFLLEMEELPAGSFKGVAAFRQTGVSVCLVIVDREGN